MYVFEDRDKDIPIPAVRTANEEHQVTRKRAKRLDWSNERRRPPPHNLGHGAIVHEGHWAHAKVTRG